MESALPVAEGQARGMEAPWTDGRTHIGETKGRAQRRSGVETVLSPALPAKRVPGCHISCFSNQWSANGSSLNGGTSTQPAER